MAKVCDNKGVFDEQVKCAGDKAIIVDFHATWCGPCKMIGPYFLELSKEYTTIICLKVDVDELDDVAEEYGIQAMPTFIVIKNGKKVDDMKGANKDRLKELFEKYK